MKTYFVAFLMSAFVCLVLTPLVRAGAWRFGLVDEPLEARKVHTQPIPRVGGVAIFASFFVPILALYFYDNGVTEAYLRKPNLVLGLFVGSALVMTLGFIDDVRGLRARTKFLTEVAIAIGVWAIGYRIGTIGNPFGDPIDIGLLSLPIMVLWIVGVTNAINLIDGMDGLATGVSLVVVVTMFITGRAYGNIIVCLTTAALAGSLVGFLRYNFNPASIFMGDSGSLFLGFVLSLSTVSGSMKSSAVVTLLVPILALGFPLMDTSMALVRRFAGGKPLFSADREHIHHRLSDMGLTDRQVVLLVYGICIAFGLLALALVQATSRQAALVLATFSAAGLGLSWSLGYIQWHRVSNQLRYGLGRQRALREHLQLIDQATRTLDNQQDVTSMLDTILELAPHISVDQLSIELELQNEATTSQTFMRTWERPPNPASYAPISHSVHRESFSLDGVQGHVQINGTLQCSWWCHEELLQVPELPLYRLLAVTLRDRVLEIETCPDSGDSRPPVTSSERSH